MSCHTRSYSKRLLFQISPLHYIEQQSNCRSTPSLWSSYLFRDRTNGYNGSLWFYQIWDTYFQLKCTWRLLFKSLKILPLLKTPTNRGLATSTMKAQVPVLRGEGWTPLFLVEKVGLRAQPVRGAILNASLCLHSHSWEVETLARHHILRV